ncbi:MULTISPECIES: DUF305 domain-containing protein [Sphingobacterium]|uniref:DUF305 domain-containing protein n=1 Tax=Sphingobacterium TaxID=28453 RepID=UPI00257F1D91|nr:MULTISPECIES: DUF305 domain-containing protein [Sphingobacterium]
MKTSHHNSGTHSSEMNMSNEHNGNHEHAGHSKGNYMKLLWMAIVSYILMFFLMYAMVDTAENVVFNINQFYMAGLMAAPMIIIEILMMRKMYANSKLNMIIGGLAAVLTLLSFLCIRQQAAVGDVQFLKSMIPHHAGAVLMVEKSSLEDPEVKKLAEDIIVAQKKEIAFMKAKINQLEKK